MYAPIEDALLAQGDIVQNVVLAYIPEISLPELILGAESVERDLTQPFDQNEPLLVLSSAHKSHVLVIEPSCNIDNDDFISVVRVHPLADPDYDRMQNAKKKADYIRKQYQRVGIEPSVYYLQECAELGFPKSFASFLEIHTIRKTEASLRYLSDNRILRLTEEALGDLQYRLGFFFGRFTVVTENYMLTNPERDLINPPAQDPD